MIYPLFAGILFRFQPFDGFHISGRKTVNPVIVIIYKGVKEQVYETLDGHGFGQKLFYISNFTPYGRYHAQYESPVYGFPHLDRHSMPHLTYPDQ